MSGMAPGEAFRQGLFIKALFRRFPDDAVVEKQVAAWRWPDGVRGMEERGLPYADLITTTALLLPVGGSDVF